MESRLKERLVGAIVLVLLGVWLIPWLLDGSNDTAESDSVALSLPSRQESVPVKTQTIDLEEERHEATATRLSGAVESRTGTSASRGGASAALPAPTPVESSTAAKTAPAAKPSASEPPTPAKAATKPPVEGEWTVQLGSFGDEANAERLAGRVSTYGFDADVSPYRAGGRLMHRVRVGPQKTRAEAEAVASSLSAHGFVAQVVTAD